MTGGEIVAKAVRLCVIGPCLGLIFGFIINKWIKIMEIDAVLEVNLMLFGSYLLFYICEFTKVHTSGVLALVVMGVYLSTTVESERESSRRKFVHELVHHIWQFLAYIAETTIFLVAGLIIGNRVLGADYLRWQDYLLLLALYALLHVIRFIGLLLFMPLLDRIGYGFSFKKVILLSYSGLRGAIALTLALVVANNEKSALETRSLILFHVAGVALLTILINGNTTGLVLKGLGLIKPSVLKSKALIKILEKLELGMM